MPPTFRSSDIASYSSSSSFLSSSYPPFSLKSQSLETPSHVIVAVVDILLILNIPQPPTTWILTHIIHPYHPQEYPPPPTNRDNSKGRTRWANLAKRKGDIPPEVRSDVKWTDTRMVFTLERNKCEVGRGGARCGRIGQVGEWNALMDYSCISPRCPSQKKW